MGKRKKLTARFNDRKIADSTVKKLRKQGHSATVRKVRRGEHIITYSYKD